MSQLCQGTSDRVALHVSAAVLSVLHSYRNSHRPASDPTGHVATCAARLAGETLV